MTTKAPLSTAAFAGFPLMREHWGAVAIWGIVYFVIQIVVTGVAMLAAAAVGYDWVEAFQSMAQDGQTNRLSLLDALSVPGSILASVVITAAIYRAVLRPQDKAGFFLRV